MRKNFFKAELFRFLQELADNNERVWFNENKARYIEYLREPMLDFIEALGERLGEVSEYYVADPRVNGGSMFRFYRDTRFSKDKTPYKTHIAFHLKHETGKNAHAPGFYLQLAPGNCRMGGGIYQGDSTTLFKLRTRIAERPEEWQKIKQGKTFKNVFGSVYGDALKRIPRGFDIDHPCAEDIKRKTFFVIQSFDDSLALSADFRDEVIDTFKVASPFMGFLTRALELRY